MADFRRWLEDAASPPSPHVAASTETPLDLHTLLGQFIALRHEVNLQTKATRAQQEQNAETLRQLSQTVEAFRQLPEKHRAEEEDLLRPLLKTLLDMADALALARREIERLQQSAATSLEQLRAAIATPPWLWGRWFGEKVNRPENQDAADRVRALLDSVLTGYAMSLQRVERALQQQGLEPIDAVGEPFDPERMEVVEAVVESGRPSGEVVAEVRRGYLWNDRVFRYAQVSVAK